MKPSVMPKKSRPPFTVHKRYAEDVAVVLHPPDSPEGRIQETEMAQYLWWNRADWDEPTAVDVERWNALDDDRKDYWYSRASVALNALRGPEL